MKKSKHIFAIMAVTYVVIAIASSLQWIVIKGKYFVSARKTL